MFDQYLSIQHAWCNIADPYPSIVPFGGEVDTKHVQIFNMIFILLLKVDYKAVQDQQQRLEEKKRKRKLSEPPSWRHKLQNLILTFAKLFFPSTTGINFTIVLSTCAQIWKYIEKDFEIAEEQIAEFSFTPLSMSWFKNVQF